MHGEEAAREVRLLSSAFRALRTGHRPTINRADKLPRALGTSITIGIEPVIGRNGVDQSEG